MTNDDQIVVIDENGGAVEVDFGGSPDNSTLYAWVEGVGYIGGWYDARRPRRWEELCASINQGVLALDLFSLRPD